jgi:hypothetical protein
MPARRSQRRRWKRAAATALVASLALPLGARAAGAQQVDTLDSSYHLRARVKPGPNAGFGAPVKLGEAMTKVKGGACNQTAKLLADGQPKQSRVRLNLIREDGAPEDAAAPTPSGGCAGKEQKDSAFKLRARVTYPLPGGGQKTSGKMQLSKAFGKLAERINAMRDEVLSSGEHAAFKVTLMAIPKGVKGMIRGLAKRHHLNVAKSLSVAKCESNFNPKAYNPAGPWAGVYQQDTDYWPGRAKKWGHKGESVFDPYANIDVSLKMARASGWHHWNCA